KFLPSGLGLRFATCTRSRYDLSECCTLLPGVDHCQRNLFGKNCYWDHQSVLTYARASSQTFIQGGAGVTRGDQSESSNGVIPMPTCHCTCNQPGTVLLCALRSDQTKSSCRYFR